ncbi:MAG: PQQ-binding-like beta-propeller repeat protein [Pirellulales bacterium]
MRLIAAVFVLIVTVTVGVQSPPTGPNGGAWTVAAPAAKLAGGSWPAGGPPLVWAADGLGEGFSAPSVVGRFIYLMGNRDGNEQVITLDSDDAGCEVWATTIGPVRHDGSGYPGPRSTPTVDGDRLYALGLNGDLVCLKRETGVVLWRKDLVADFGGTIPNWGYSESVLIDGPAVICTPGGAQATLVALDKLTGETIWSAAIGDAASYSSIMPAVINEVKQYVQFTAAGVVGVDASDGTLLWRYNAPANGTANIATPIISGDSVFAASGYGTGGGRVDVSGDGRMSAAEEAYFTKSMKNHHGGMVLVDGYIYGCNDPGRLTCLDFATGDVLWSERDAGKCAVTYVDGMIIARDEKGPVSLVDADSAAFALLGQFEQPRRSEQPSWPHPVVSDGRLYLRDGDVLLCHDLRETSDN